MPFWGDIPTNLLQGYQNLTEKDVISGDLNKGRGGRDKMAVERQVIETWEPTRACSAKQTWVARCPCQKFDREWEAKSV